MIQVTDPAREELRLRAGGRFLRVSGRQVCDCGKVGFDLSVESNLRPGDRTERVGPLEFVIDADSLPYVDGLTIDFHADLMGKSFVLKNPTLPNGGECGG